ncbi:MAG: hypothetical protein HY670_02850 [Chloroflexi bacterium]|nr:hypothetical protein [Chloroflexota bacterium]
MESKTTYFEKPGKDNTEATLAAARERADSLGIKTVLVATTRGNVGARTVEVFQGCKVIVVTHATGFHDTDVQELTAENRKLIEGRGGIIVTTGHTLAGIDRAWRTKHNTYVLADIVADTLRLFGQGMKVVCEIAAMAADAGLVRTDEDVISIAGAGKGADTAVVLTPANSHRFFDMKVKEIICKPLPGAQALSHTH